MEEVKRIGRDLKYSGSIVDVYTDHMLMPNGNTAEWDYVEHRKGAAAVLPVLDNGNILMVKQYRSAVDCISLEIPAGSRDSVTEPTIECASRELEEETGYRSDNLEFLINVATTVAFCNERIDIYMARDLQPSRQHLDENEFLDVYEYSPEELVNMVYSGEICDAKSIAAILAYANKYLR